MQRIKRLAAAAAAVLFGMLIALGTAGSASAVTFNGYTDVPSTTAADTTDGATLSVYCDDDRYGSIGWNDYADNNHSNDIDNVIVYDQSWDGMSISVSVYNSTNGRTNVDQAYSGERLSIDVGNVANGDYVEVTASRWDNGSPNCERERTVTKFWE